MTVAAGEVRVGDEVTVLPIGARTRVAAIDRFVPDPAVRLNPDGTARAAETGANLLDKSLAVILRGVLGKSAARIAQGRDAIGPGLLYVTHGDGFYRDGSFIQHDHVPYTGSYGPAVIDDMSRLLYLLDGSRWALTVPNVANVYDWAIDAYLPFLYDGADVEHRVVEHLPPLAQVLLRAADARVSARSPSTSASS